MKKLNKLVASAVVGVMAVVGVATLASCENTNYDYSVGICQFMEHSSLDEASKGFTDELTRLMTEQGKTIKFIKKSANGDTGQQSTATSTLINKKPDLILAIATPSAQSLATATSTIPLLYTAVTDPVGAELTGSNVTGTSDLGDISKQADLIDKLMEGKEKYKVGILYTLSEPNSVVQRNLMTTELGKNSRASVKEKGINELSDVGLAMTNLSDCDIIYIPTDNKLADAMPTVRLNNPSKLPIVTGATDMAMQGGVASYGAKYYELGKQTAQMAFDILFSGKNPSEIEFQYAKGLQCVINEEIATEIGFTIPQSVRDLLEQ